MGSSIFSVYNRHPVVSSLAKGARLTAEDVAISISGRGRVNALGAHPHLVTALSEQAARLGIPQPLPILEGERLAR